MTQKGQQQSSRILKTQDIQKQILFWNINTINNISAYSSLIQRVQNKQKPNKYDLEIRDFYFTNKLTIDGKFQAQSFIEKSAQYIKNFKSLDKNAYLQSVNFQNSLKKYRFWRNIVDSLPKDKENHQVKQQINKIIWVYRLPYFVLFTSLIYVFMMGVGFTKMKKGKQLAMLAGGMYIADIFAQRRKATDIFYTIPELEVKELERERKNLINHSIILDGKIYQLDKETDFQSAQLIKQAKYQEDQSMRKALLQAAGYKILQNSQQLI